MEFNLQDYKTQGIKFNYYYICKRKLWLFDKGIAFENSSDRVLQGKTVHESSYKREENKEVLIDDTINVDIFNKEYVKEVKITSKMGKADRMQLLYYLFYLKQVGIEKKGAINYVKEKKVEEVILTEKDEEEIKLALVEIKNILSQDKPPSVVKLPYCKKCSYYEFCYVREV